MNVFDEIVAERQRQDEKFGIQNHTPGCWLIILMEEVGEAAHALLEGDLLDWRKELVSVAAVAVAALEVQDRRP